MWREALRFLSRRPYKELQERTFIIRADPNIMSDNSSDQKPLAENKTPDGTEPTDTNGVPTAPFGPQTDVHFATNMPLGGARIPVLLPLRGITSEKLYILDKQETWIGRSTHAEIQLTDGLVSRFHAKVVWENSDHPNEFPRCILLDGQSRNGTFVNRKKIQNEPLSDGDRVVIGSTLLAYLVKDTQELDYDSRILYRATTDSLTFVANRVSFEEAGIHAVNAADRHKQPLSLCLIDIDIFKDINDKWGHPAGDQVLRHLASMLLLSVRNSDVVGRLGGDEFGIVLTGADLNDAYTTMLKLCMDIAATPCAVEMGLIPFAVSIGVAGLKLPEMDWAALSKAADENLYKAKQSGRNCVIAR